MTRSVYYPKPLLQTIAALLIFLLAAWGDSVLLKVGRSPVTNRRIIPFALFSNAALSCLVGLLVREPLLRVDETGIAYHPKRFPKIEWPDVLGVERAPMIEPTPDGLINHIKYGWQPVNIFVANSDKYLRRLPKMLRQRLIEDEPADSVRFQIVFMGLSPVSAEVYDCIRRHLDARGVNV